MPTAAVCAQQAAPYGCGTDLAEHGEQLQHAVVSGRATVPGIGSFTRHRIKFVDAAVLTPVGGVRVRLECAGEPVIGRAENGASRMEEMRSAAQAAVDALRQILPAHTSLALTDVAPVAALGQAFLLAVIELRRGREIRTLLGVCPLSLNVVRDAALAVLDATNRVVSAT
jgi:hypothetical protein